MRDRTVLVTGGAGFVGSHLCRRLKAEGYHVISLDNYFVGDHSTHVEGVEYRWGHTKDIGKIISETPAMIYHLGEYSRVEKSLGEPNTVFDLNIIGTHSVVEFWRKHGCKLIYAGSSTKFADDGLGRHQSPYAWTKAVNTEWVQNYGNWFKLDYAITYFYNVYGPGERAGAYGTVVEIFRQLHAKGKPLTVVSPGTQKRIFTHVDDIVDGLILVGERGEGDEFGLGAKESFSILEVAQMFGGKIEMLPERAGNRMGAVIDTSKSKLIGWEAKRSVRDYIEQVKKAAKAA